MDQSMGPGAMIFSLIIGIIIVVAEWKIYVKAGKPGWAILIPIYNIIVMLEIVEKPIWWIILMFIPIANVIVMIMVVYNLVLKFDKPGWHTVLAILFSFVYFPYLGFSDAQYVGSAAPAAEGASS